MLASARAFFSSRHILEVDCPLITAKGSVDAHIDLIPVLYNGSERRYLHSSPEYGMKKLLSEGLGHCYQLAHVFRDGEYGPKHNPEFTLAEWYRLDMPFDAFIEESLAFIRLFLGDLPSFRYSYKNLFELYLDINPFTATIKDLEPLLATHGIELSEALKKGGKDSLLNILLGTLIEPKLGKEELAVLVYYPPSQAALAKTTNIDGDTVACRFEIYYKGIELANGYDELADPDEQRQRLKEANCQRSALGKEALPLDEDFLKALEKGLPACCGVAIGFDRLMMLRHHAATLSEVIPFDWSSA
jgi:lysyl-tRNA synthetase class 2